MNKIVVNMIAIAFLGVLVIVSQSYGSCKLPFAKRCKRNDPYLAECWKSILEELPPYLENGIPEMGVPPIDPLRSPDYYDVKGPTFNIGHSYMEHSGTKHFEVVKNTINLQLNVIFLKLRFPKLDHTCTTFANGTLIGFQLLDTEGCNAAEADVTFTFMLKGRRKTIKGKEHIEFHNIDITVDGKYTKQEYHNFVGGGAAGNLQFAVAAEQAIAIFSPIYNECLKSSIGRNIANAIKNVYFECPLDTLHPLM